MDWPLAEAKNRFSEVVTRALNEGPQRVRRRDQVVIVLSELEYQRLLGERPLLKNWLFDGPDFEGLDISRDASPMRDISL
jgi:hypothetical protein